MLLSSVKTAAVNMAHSALRHRRARNTLLRPACSPKALSAVLTAEELYRPLPRLRCSRLYVVFYRSERVNPMPHFARENGRK